MQEQAGLPRLSALAAASGLLLLAWNDVGLTGVFFLAAFEVWALACVAHRPAAALRLPAQSLWSCVALAACAILFVQLILQSVLLASHPSWASSTHVQLVLHWLGFSKADGGTRLLAVVAAPCFLIVASVLELRAIRKQRPEQGTVSGVPSSRNQQQDSHPFLQHPGPRSHRAAGLTNAGVLTSAALLASALARPSLLSLPYAMLVCYGILLWALQWRSSWSVPAIRTFQLYCGLHIVLLYLWQIPPLRHTSLSCAAPWLGLYTVTGSQGSLQVLFSEVLHLVALHVLFVALAFYAVLVSARRRVQETHGPGAALSDLLQGMSARWAGSSTVRHELQQELEEALLGPIQHMLADERPDYSGQRMSQGGGRLNQNGHHAPSGRGQQPRLKASAVAELVLPFTAGLLLALLDAASKHPAVAAVALCSLALAQPCLINTVCLVAGLWTLLAPKGLGVAPLMRTATGWCCAFLAWQLTSYTLTAVRSAAGLPSWLAAVGLLPQTTGLLLVLQLSAELAAACIVGGLARRQPTQRLPARVVGRQPSQTGTASLATSEIEVDNNQPAGGQLAPQLLPPSSIDAWASVVCAVARTAWYAGFLVFPAVLIGIGLSQGDLLHSAYLLIVTVYFLAPTVTFQLDCSTASIGNEQHKIERTYASLHLTAMYIARVACSPSWNVVHFPDVKALRVAGLICPSVPRSMLPVFVGLVVAYAHATLGRWLHRQGLLQARSCVSSSDQEQDSAARQLHKSRYILAGHPALVHWFGKLALSYGVLLVVLVGYLLLLWGSDVGALGLGYLFLLSVVFVCPLGRRAFKKPAGPGPSLVLVGSSRFRWVPLALLSLWAASDLAFQYALASTNLPGALGLSKHQLRLIKDIAGIDAFATGTALALRLLRPLVLLGAVHLLQFGYSVGSLQAQQEEHARLMGSSSQRSHSQRGMLPLLKRFLILHSSKLLAVAAFAAAMQQPGAIGSILVVGIVMLTPLLGGPQARSRRPLLLASIMAVETVAVAWLLMEYSIQIHWLRNLLGPIDGLVVQMLQWAGLRPVETGAANLEAVLRMKFFVLVAIVLKRRALRWEKQLPAEVREAGKAGNPCCLFWPPTAVAVHDGDTTAEGVWARLRKQSFVQSLLLAVQQAQDRVRSNTSRALRAIDWPETSDSNARGTGVHQADANDRQLNASSHTEVGERHKQVHRLARWLHQIKLFRLAAQDLSESLWQDWGLEISMLALILSAFLFINLLSLFLIALVAVGMAVHPNKRRHLWRLMVVPTLAVLLILEYAVLVGLPPPLRQSGQSGSSSLAYKLFGRTIDISATDYPAPHSLRLADGPLQRVLLQVASHHKQDPRIHQYAKDWLGIGHIEPAALWGLFLAFATSIMQMHYDLWYHSPNPAQNGQRPAPARPVARNEVMPQQPPSEAQPSQPQQPFSAAQAIWMPLKHEAQGTWRWLDWTRYLLLRHYTDAVLITVVALCALENDVIHAGYLALALLLFRRRETLRLERSRLFKWMAIYNFAVIVLTLAFQAPFEDAWGSIWEPQRKGCNFSHVLGLNRLTGPSGPVFSLGSRGALADIILWAIIRLQTRLFATTAFTDAVQCFAKEQIAATAAVERWRWLRKRAQAATALEASRLRKARAARVEKLKAGVSRSGGSVGVDPALLELDRGTEFDESDWEQQMLDAPDSVDHKEPIMGAQASAASRGDTADEASWQSGMAEDRISLEHGASGQPTPSPSDHTVPPDALVEDGPNSRASSNARPQRKFWAWLQRRWQHGDKESFICYVLYILLFVIDYSLLALVLPLSLFCYAQLAQHPSRLYWQACLLYVEGILICQYVYQIPSRLHCDFIDPAVQASAEWLGLHSSVVRAIPTFAVYLATLMHVYHLGRQQASPLTLNHPGQAAQPSFGGSEDNTAGPHSVASDSPDTEPGSQHPPQAANLSDLTRDLEMGLPQRRPAPPSEGDSSQDLPDERQMDSLTQLLRSFWHSLAAWAIRGSLAVYEFLQTVCSPSEPPLHFVKVEVEPQHDVRVDWKASEGAEFLRQHMQSILDQCRHDDLAAAMSCRQMQGSSGELASVTEDERHMSLPQVPADNVETTHQAAGNGSHEGAERPASCIDLATIGPLRLLVEAVLTGASASTVTVLLQVLPERSTSQNSEGLSQVEGWPIRSLRPAEHAAQTILRRQQERSGNPGAQLNATAGHAEQQGDLDAGRLDGASSMSSPPGSSGRGNRPDHEPPHSSSAESASPLSASPSASETGKGMQATPAILEVQNVEWHSRPAQDFYAATAAVDFITFLYVVVFYQSIVNSARSLQDISDERVVPLDYLLSLIVLFMFLVLDRVFYTLGSPLGKALLLWSQMAVFYIYVLKLFWSPTTSSTARTHLRVAMLLKSCAFVLYALQLRHTYPPRASYRGGRGRHAFMFMRHTNMFGWLGMQVFNAVPFIYELRALLDWSCTPTTLTLFDWLKLEDINVSLFLVTVDRQNRDSRRRGERIPRYQKFLQGTLLFVGLLILLWVPLLVFSSGNPTYQVPSIVSFSANASLGTMHKGSGSFEAITSFPLYEGGARRMQQPWLSNGSFPDKMGDDYSPEQLILLCLAKDSDSVWSLSPPARDALLSVLHESSAALSVSWTVVRSAPPPSTHGNPICTGTAQVPLAGLSRMQLLDMLQGNRSSATLMRLDSQDPHGTRPSHGGPLGLFGLFWQLRGDMCSVRPFKSPSALAAKATRASSVEQYVGCNATTLSEKGSAQPWWRFSCGVFDGDDNAVDNREQGWATCQMSGLNGLRLVAILERVQGGLLGETLSSFGITGLYITVVYAVGRLLRLSMSNLRTRIMYEDLPNTKRLVALCEDIYIARAEGELLLEGELYFAMISIYRSPQVLFELTKKKEA